MMSTSQSPRPLKGKILTLASLLLNFALMLLILMSYNHFSLTLVSSKLKLLQNDQPNILALEGSDLSTSSLASQDKGKEQSVSYQGVCTGKDGVLLVEKGDSNSAVGTFFFLYVANHLIYADMYNLHPWIHLQPNPPCYDAFVHSSPPTSFSMLSGIQEQRIYGKGDSLCRVNKAKSYYPGPPDMKTSELEMKEYTLDGSGIWNTYFETTGFPPSDPSCQSKPLLVFHKKSVDPGLHFCAPWASQAWPHRNRPKTYQPGGQNDTVHQWFGAMRQRSSKIVAKYFRPLPWLKHQIQQANPNTQCLSIHARMTDKGNGRRKTSLKDFQPYAETYSHLSGGKPIYVATDDANVLESIRTAWDIPEDSLIHQKNVIRMNGGTAAIFHLFQNETHRTNTEGLVDIFALAKCDFFLHSYSALAESVIYVNPELHNRSVNMDVPREELVRLKQFEEMVAKHYGLDLRALSTDVSPKATRRRPSLPRESNLEAVLSEQVRVQNEFQQLLYQNQFPSQDCRKRRILLTWKRPGPWDGFTLEMQDMGRRIMSALATDRTLILRDNMRSAYAPPNCQWKTGVRVNATNDWTCLYEPLSNCTEKNSDWKESQARGDRANSSIPSGLGVVDHEGWSLFFTPKYYGNLRVVEGFRFSRDGQRFHDVDRILDYERMMGRFWLRAQAVHFLWKLSPGLKSEVEPRLPSEELFSNKYIGMHIRFSDNRPAFEKDFGRNASATRTLANYLSIAQGIRDETGISNVYLATDNPRIVDQIPQYSKHWKFWVQKDVIRSDSEASLWFRNDRSTTAAQVAADLEVLRRADYLIGSFQSNVYRLATELNTAYMVDRYPISRKRHRPVDVEWYEDP